MKKLFFIVFLLLAYTVSYAQFAEVSTRLKQKLSSMSPMEYTPVLILLKDRVNIEALDAQLYSQKANAQFRAKTVIEALTEKARSTQGPILSALEKEGYTLAQAEVTMIPQTTVELPEEKKALFNQMIDKLEEDDDVSEVFHNAEL